MKKILLLSAYHAQSHAYWADQLMARMTEFEWTLLSLPARYFAWRIRGNPLSFKAKYSHELAQHYDVIVATSMTDLALVKALNPHLAQVPSLLYFHENQFAYPSSPQQEKANIEAQMVTLYSALAADVLVFNSDYNRQSYLQGVSGLLKKMPDLVDMQLLETLQAKSQLLAVPINQQGFVSAMAQAEKQAHARCGLRLCWAARWEYDKGPAVLLEIVEKLEQQGIEYQLAVLGQSFRTQPEPFAIIEQQYSHRLSQFGFLASREDYLAILASSDVFLSTAEHEFFGISVAEAHALACELVLPNKLVYPELYPDAYLYRNSDEAVKSLVAIDQKAAIKRPMNTTSASCQDTLLADYQTLLIELMEKNTA